MATRAYTLAALSLSLTPIGPSLASEAIEAPVGLKPCPQTDPIARVEERLATKLSGDFLGCFRSDLTEAASSPTQPASMPTEYAFAVALHNHSYSSADLHALLSRVEQQWKDFQPVDGDLSDAYIARLIGQISEQRDASAPSVQSIRPVLVKIDGDHESYYTVTSIRTYVFASGAASVSAVKVNADAVVLRNSSLIRLTIQRTLSGSADVARAQADIDRWAKSIT